MKDPQRLFDATDSSTRAMLEAARADGPSPRTHRGAAIALGLGSLGVASGTVASSAAAATVGAGAAAATAPVAGGAALAAGTAVKWVGIAALVGAASWGAAEVATRPTPTTPTHAAAPLNAPTVATGSPRMATTRLPSPAPDPAPTDVAPSPLAAPQPLAAPPPPPVAPRPPPSRRTASAATPPLDLAPPSPRAPAPAAPRAASTLVAETAKLEAARAALQTNDPTRALTALDDYGSAFPRGVLAPEATVLRVEALARRGGAADRAAAQRLGEAFLREHPASPLCERVRILVSQTSIP